jgi:hypothetical protein
MIATTTPDQYVASKLRREYRFDSDSQLGRIRQPPSA